MNQRVALTVSAALTVFVMVILAAVVLALQFVKPVAAAEPVTVAPAATSTGLDPAAVQAMLDQRDAQYRQALDQANTQLQDAYTKQEKLQAQLDGLAQAQAQLDGLAQAQAQAKAANAFLLLDPNTGQLYMVANPMGNGLNGGSNQRRRSTTP
jgi:hypothetical protein